ncbi:MAG: DNA-directed RNA polymerase subunit alpha C-terminal domain-containing protein, partial [Gemmatimonadota bacterium]
RVGQRTDFDRLTIQVETDGSIEPGDAVAYAAELGQTHLSYLLSFGSAGNGQPMAAGPASGGRRPVSPELSELLGSELADFDGISIRSRNNLDKADIHTLFDVVTMTRDDVLNVPSFGEKSLEEVAEVVALNGLRFGMHLERDEDGALWVLEDDEGASEDSDEA